MSYIKGNFFRPGCTRIWENDWIKAIRVIFPGAKKRLGCGRLDSEIGFRRVSMPCNLPAF